MEEKMENLCTNLAKLEEQTIVLYKKQENIQNLARLSEITYKTKCALVALKLNLNIEKLKQAYKQTNKRCELQQHQMLYLLKKVDEIQESMGQKSAFLPKTVLQPVMECNNFSPAQSAIKQSMITDQTPLRMRIADYENSPFISRRKPFQMQFLDFEAHISPEEFATIPSYMKGRESLDELRGFLENTVISCFTEKYTLLCKTREAIRNTHDVEIWKIYKQQKNDFPGKYFVTEGDIARKIGRLVDKKMNSKLTMLRHLNIIKEVRKIKTTYYLWNLS